MTLNPKHDWTDADHAYAALRVALADPAKRSVADENPALGAVFQKLSDQDLRALAAVIGEQRLTGHGAPFDGLV